MGYTTPASVRDRIGGCTGWTDPLLQILIDRASNFIDFATGNWFEIREMVLNIDGKGTQTLLVPVPIIAISKIELIDWPGVASGIGEVDLEGVAIYNRHLTAGLSHPDDRRNPKIAFLGVVSGLRNIAFDRWPAGKQNVRLTGRFGWTDPNFSAGRSVATDALDTITAPDAIHMENGAFTDEDIGKTITIAGSASNDGAYVILTIVGDKDITTSEQTLTTEGDGFTATLSTFPQWGATPWGIQELCELVIIKDMPVTPGKGIGGPQDGAWYERMMRAQGRVTREKVRDQEIQYAALGNSDSNASGLVTGDPQIDMLIASFSPPAAMRAV